MVQDLWVRELEQEEDREEVWEVEWAAERPVPEDFAYALHAGKKLRTR